MPWAKHSQYIFKHLVFEHLHLVLCAGSESSIELDRLPMFTLIYGILDMTTLFVSVSVELWTIEFRILVSEGIFFYSRSNGVCSLVEAWPPIIVGLNIFGNGLSSFFYWQNEFCVNDVNDRY
jgi:hypothetical protein